MIKPASTPTLTPADIARVALKRLGEMGLPPTPENYSRFYNAITTIKSASEQSEEELKGAYRVLFRVNDVLDSVHDLTHAVLAELSRSSEEMGTSLEALQATDDRQVVSGLLQHIIDSTGQVYSSVAASQRDLNQLKESMLAVQADLAINRKTLEQDPLTGALNRQGFEHVLLREVKRAQRHGGKLTTAVIDLDHFRDINDRYGRQVGDRILTHFSSVAKAVLRDSDTLVRYGGEEFLLLLPETDLHGAGFLLDRLRHVNLKTPFFQQQQRIEVRFSAGLAQWRPDENGHAMVLRADEALNQAKHSGRDTVIHARLC
ncbi:GGDEF domain-containing protein [Parachitinimonas caeni]|uniref:diguanylate cyclase n=1 Tax=Parachitinimonas caeni TaxID=3031301 RepID=A0ABT7E1V4_9NEIS|nr:GGDEF domain-containing protein [Parachitinimonas caeni]MDK2126290.1 GGDEF domain-containing protein [Parachitinimonas caeni]